MSEPIRHEHPAMPWLRRFWLAGLLGGLATLIVCFLIFAATGSALDPTTPLGRLMGSAAAVPILCTFGLIAVKVTGRGGLVPFMIFAMLCIAIAAVGWVVLIHRTGSESFAVVRWLEITGTATIIGPGLALLGTSVTSAQRGRVIIALRRTTTVLGVLAALSGLGIVWSPLARRFVEVPLVIGVVSLVGMLAAAALLLLAVRIAALRDRRRRESLPESINVHITCPQCGDEAPRPTGPSRCPTCGHALIIELQEPCCDCGYLIYRLDRDVCPECGRALVVRSGG